MQGDIQKRQGANLPHWTREGATYFITFRLADSLPKSAVDKLRHEKAHLDREFTGSDRPISPEDLVRRSRLNSKRYLDMLDEAHGDCLLKNDSIAEIVANALMFFEGQRYRLFAWCIMLNHVHAVVQPVPEFELSSILHSWKSFTANKSNKALGRTGSFWQVEYFDHLIRDQGEFDYYVKYTRDNPAKAGLVNWQWVG